MIRLINNGPDAFALSFKGIEYIIPPKGGGIYRSVAVENERDPKANPKIHPGYHQEIRRCGDDDSIPNFADLPDDANAPEAGILRRGAMKARMEKAGVVMKIHLVEDLDRETTELRQKNMSLLDQQNALIADIERLKQAKVGLEIDKALSARRDLASMMPNASPQALVAQEMDAPKGKKTKET